MMRLWANSYSKTTPVGTSATLSVDQIVDMVDDLIDAHGELIPEAIRRT